MLTKLEKMSAGLDSGCSPSVWDHSVRPNYVDLGLNLNSIPYKTDTAIIVTAWHEQLPYMKCTFKNYRLTDKFIIGAYDFPFYSWSKGNIADLLPAIDVWLLAHTWVFKHITYDNDKRNGWFWDIRYAQGIVKQFDNIKYVFHVNADCIWEKPQGVDELISLIKNADFMCVTSDEKTKHTCAVVYKVDAFHAIFDSLINKFRVPTVHSHSPEIILREAVNELGLKEFVAPIQPMDLKGKHVDHYSCYAQDSTWKRILGYRNLAAEHITALIEGLEPIDKKYIDVRFKRQLCTREELLKYYETGDRRWLHKLWDINEESWYNRAYYPLEYYGEKPIMNKENDPWMVWLDSKKEKK